MNCSWPSERFEELLDGTLTPGERTRVLAHVGSCRDCGSLLDELRAIDGLLLTPRHVSLNSDFTRATMDELRAQPAPGHRSCPIAAYVVCYLVAAWSLIAAACVLSPQLLRAVASMSLASGRTVIDAFGGVGHALARLTDPGAVVLLDSLLGLALLAIARRARPLIAERLRW